MTDGSVQPFKDRRAAPVNTAGQFRRGAEPLIAAAYERLVGPKETFRPDRSGEITDRHVAALLGVDIVMARWPLRFPMRPAMPLHTCSTGSGRLNSTCLAARKKLSLSARPLLRARSIGERPCDPLGFPEMAARSTDAP